MQKLDKIKEVKVGVEQIIQDQRLDLNGNQDLRRRSNTGCPQ